MRLRVLLCSLVLFPACVSISTHEKLRKDYEASRGRLEELESRLAESEKQNEDLKTSQEELKNKIDEIRSTYDELVESLKDDIRQGDIGLQNVNGKLTITMGNQVLFKSGSAALQTKGQKILSAISKSLRKVKDNDIQVEGHSDNIRISGPLKSRYPTNWELSADRATSVVRFLQEKGGVDPTMIVLSAFSEYRPAADNASPAGREKNRRVEISLIPKKP
jgi:chemotaxis protein MotB